MPRLEIAQQFVDQARISQTQSELARLLEDGSAEIGFHYFALVHHVDLRRASANIIRLENYPAPWASHFVENGLYAEDPIHRACLTSNVGFAWTEVSRMIAITGRQRSILEDAAKYGLGDGYTVPANIPGESSGSCSFATRRGLTLPTGNLLLAQVIGAFAFQAARRLIGNRSIRPQDQPRLTPRQRDCLILAIQGKTDWEGWPLKVVAHRDLVLQPYNRPGEVAP